MAAFALPFFLTRHNTLFKDLLDFNVNALLTQHLNEGVINLMSHTIEFLFDLAAMVWVDKAEVAEMSSDEIACLVV